MHFEELSRVKKMAALDEGREFYTVKNGDIVKVHLVSLCIMPNDIGLHPVWSENVCNVVFTEYTDALGMLARW